MLFMETYLANTIKELLKIALPSCASNAFRIYTNLLHLKQYFQAKKKNM